MVEIIHVGAESQPASVAAAIANTIRKHRRAEVQAIGVGAVNQMMKATIVARRYLVPDKLDLCITPDFTTVHIDERQLTALKLYVWGDELDGNNR
jgi:stage V sporulation protein S